MRDKMRIIMDRQGLSQLQLAKKIGVSKKTLSFWVNGKAQPKKKYEEVIDRLYQECEDSEQGKLQIANDENVKMGDNDDDKKVDLNMEKVNRNDVKVNEKVNSSAEIPDEAKVNSDLKKVKAQDENTSKKANVEDAKVKIQGLLYDSGKEGDDEESFYKNELAANEKRAQYYQSKKLALQMEVDNKSKLILFPSLGGKEGEWYKMGGVSALIYMYRVGPRIGRRPSIKKDGDKRERFVNGIISVHWLEGFIQAMKKIGYTGYSVDNENGLVIFDLGQEFTETEIKAMKEQEKRRRELFQNIVKPKVSYPEIYAHYLQLAKILPVKVRKMDVVHRDLLGRRLTNGLIKIGSVYYNLTDGRMSADDARNQIIDIIDDMIAVLMILDASELMPESGLLRLGIILTDLKDAVGKMMVKKDDANIKMIGSLAKG